MKKQNHRLRVCPNHLTTYIEKDINAFLNIKEIAYFMQWTKKIFNNIDKAILFSSLGRDPNKKVN